MLVFNQTNKGTYRRANQLAKGLTQRGHKVSLICTSISNKIFPSIREESGVTYFESPDLFSGSLRSGWDLWNAANRIRWLKTLDCDIIHSFESRPVCIIPALAARKRKRIPLVLDWADWFGTGGSIEERHNPIIKTLLRPIENYFELHYRGKVEGATVINSVLYKRAIDSGIQKKNIIILPNGSDTSGIIPLDKLEARRYLGLKQDADIIGHVGTIFFRDAQLMVNAFDQLMDEKSNSILLLIGKIPFDMTKISRYGKSIIQTGWVNENKLNYWISAMDIGWMPMTDSAANRGRFPLKIHDYLAAGLPIISTDVGDIKKFFAGHSFGKIVEPNPREIAEVTISLLDSPDLLDRMGKEARLVAENEFNWQQSVDILNEYYGRLISLNR